MTDVPDSPAPRSRTGRTGSRAGRLPGFCSGFPDKSFAVGADGPSPITRGEVSVGARCWLLSGLLPEPGGEEGNSRWDAE